MKAEELRIGNFVINKKINKDDQSCLVTGFLVHTVWMKYSYIDQHLNEEINEIPASIREIDPIPLTEGWLLKFGFEQYSDGSRFYLENFNHIEEHAEEFYVMFQTHCGDFSELNIKYVHQLQNLYFALTGSELTIKESAGSTPESIVR